MSAFTIGDRVRIVGDQLHPDRAEYAGQIGTVVAVHDGGEWDYTVDLGGDWGWDWFAANELEGATESADEDVTTLRRAAALARVEAQEQDGPSRTVTLNFASMLENEADKVESGDRGTLPPVLASARM